MKFLLTAVAIVLLHCQLADAAFCSDEELAGECFENKVKVLAIIGTAGSVIFGIAAILLTVGLLCKAKRRRRAKVMVYRKPYEKSQPRLRSIDNSGFESATQYYVKRPSDRMPAAYVEPSYLAARNGRKPVKDDLDLADSLDMFAGEGKRGESYRSSELAWVPGNGKKLRAEVNGNGYGNGSYYN